MALDVRVQILLGYKKIPNASYEGKFAYLRFDFTYLCTEVGERNVSKLKSMTNTYVCLIES